MPQVRADLERLVRIPSVSAVGWDPAPLERSAEAVAEILAASGAKTKILTAKGGHPAVVGWIEGPKGAPRVLLYAHHDVQPQGPESAWVSPPYEPRVRDGRLYGRGSADDKAGVAAHAAALRAFDGKPPCGVAIFVEGEEEAGSGHLREYLERARDLLRADAVVIADGGNWRVGQPALTATLRGVIACVVEVRALDHAVHSGQFGGVFPDALTALARLLATLHDERGRVAVAGLVRADADPLDLTEDELRAWAGARPGVRAIGEGSLTSRMWRQPALSVLGIDAPTIRESSNQLVPVARARVSLRIPPGQDGAAAMRALVSHLKSHAPWGVEVTVQEGPIGEPFLAATSGPAYEAMHAALAAAWDRRAVDAGTGGTIPFLHDFTELFPGASILVTGVEDPSSNAHGENESLHLGDFENACVAEALFLEAFARRR